MHTFDGNEPTLRIAILAVDGLSMFHLATPLLVFEEAARHSHNEVWESTIWTLHGDSVRLAEGHTIGELAGRDVAEQADLIIIPAWPNDLPEASSELVELLRAAHRSGTVIAGLCLAAFPLASAGLLDGREAVTHWAESDELSRRHPSVKVNSSALYIDHGDVMTSAGTASSLDACLHIVRSRAGATTAAAVARLLVVAPHRDGDQAQYIARPLIDGTEVGEIAEVLEWAQGQLESNLTVGSLASHAQMSTRNFTRRFQEATGTSPAKWVLTRRLDEARMLLETTRWEIDRIARTCGFGSAVTFRQNFVGRYSTTPTSYRNRFQGKQAPATPAFATE